MIEQELLFLGLLKESPKHGYEIKKEIREILSTFVGVELKSIYYPLKVLKEKGFLVKKITRQGKRPLRFIYTLTSKGEARFNQLLNKSFLDFKRPQFSLDLSLYFLKFIKPRLAKRRLKARISVLKRLSQILNQTISSLKDKKASSILSILEHNLQMVETESRFLAHFITTI
jgi:DNA-binding PadR family transcriptional regulator